MDLLVGTHGEFRTFWHLMLQLVLGFVAASKINTVLYVVALIAVGDLVIIWGITFFIWLLVYAAADAKKIEHFHRKVLITVSWSISMLFAFSLNF